ncbi:hypothetical protein HanXRQr2_Chr12g0533141 [Helianthus annuus]|uniref:Uncharacterized protein n=1 Tax=Helianthus annuus TaxID=4232 RepID=A0A251UHZ0_HELAN|nr:hypothetical protein HanXRQr2_Chr12g0533141 [Helianthus annuus]KAJ0488802.1 hypothetical protein HanHA300_Chr12g0436881 [Helianthus annuus]KAJ0492387.1 hypothetical protein HanIR_Chr12g0574301 [Helianthus annuus]KAJ0504642.1 hypothetical protein HanHA89_Chr12g0461551 [Helianthus annuus]KAJ0674377.1 hypothetical protein HanLR1_Chr12g0439261 [Helianthus annuus]
MFLAEFGETESSDLHHTLHPEFSETTNRAEVIGKTLFPPLLSIQTLNDGAERRWWFSGIAGGWRPGGFVVVTLVVVLCLVDDGEW